MTYEYNRLPLCDAVQFGINLSTLQSILGNADEVLPSCTALYPTRRYTNNEMPLINKVKTA